MLPLGTILLAEVPHAGAQQAVDPAPRLVVVEAASPADPPKPQPSGPVTIEQVERSLNELEQSADVAVDVKMQAVENYRAAIKNLQSAADSDARLKTLIAETETVSERFEQLKQQLAELKGKKPDLPSGLELAELEQLLPTTELQLSQFKKTRQDAEAELETRVPRRKEIRSRMNVVQEKIAEAATQLKALTAAQPTVQSQSLIARLLTRRTCLEKEMPTLEAELAKFDAEEAANLVRLRIDVATQQANFTEKTIALLQQQINTAREAAAEEAVRVARREAISADPALKYYAEQNQVLAESAKQVAESLAATNAQLTAATEAYEGLLREFARTKKKVDSVGLTSSVGALLRKQKTTLPDVALRQAAVAQRQKIINDTQYELLEYEEAQQAIADSEAAIQQILHQAKQDTTKNVMLLESAARDLVKRKREYLDDLVRSTGQYFDTLIELDTLDQQIIQLEAEYENYMDQRVLWIRSGPPLTNGIEVAESETWLLSTAKWQEAGHLLTADIKQHFALYIACTPLLGLLLLRRRKLRNAIRDLGVAAEKANCRSIVPTLRGIWLTSVVAMALPMACYFLGWRLAECAGDSTFTSALGHGFQSAAIVWLSIDMIRQLCRRKGVGESHFRWPVHLLAAFRAEARRGVLFAMPIVFVTATLAVSGGAHERGDLQRIAYIVGMVLVAIAVVRLLSPSVLLREHLADHPNGLASKTRYLLPICGAALPLSLAALAAAGYFFTAQTLLWRLFATCTFVASLVVLRSLLYRMLLLRRRHLSIEQARLRAAAAQQAGEAAVEQQPVAGIVTENSQADISTQNHQSRNLVRAGVLTVGVVGMWMIWTTVLPALNMIGNYPLWPATSSAAVASVASPPTPLNAAGVTDGADSTSAASAAVNEGPIGEAITMSDLALAILIVVIAAVLFRNGPGLLEMSVLQQLPLDASVRYAITTLASYAIVLVGTIAACSTIGLKWAQIQWLATALTFGLAFGLQEMFANFVAGLIILLERPIRVGDIVTVDDVTGVVSRIRIRATSITNWDRKEYVVPNKEFITGRLLNWTLSDKVNRIVIEVGLAYGADTERARELLLESARNHPTVLKDPAPLATFEGFGDNSLNLVLRAFLPSLENRLQIIHELHTAINQAFRKANLEIAFPQRDLHIRTISSLPAALVAANNSEQDASSRDAA